VRRGGAVVKVDVDEDAQVDEAREALQNAGAVDIDERINEWRASGWTDATGAPTGTASLASASGATGGLAAVGSSVAPGPQQADEDAVLRAQAAALGEVVPIVKTDIETYRQSTGTAGIRVYPRAESSSSSPTFAPFDDYSHEFQSHFNTNYVALGSIYSEFEPAYRYGHQLAGDTRYRGRSFDEFEHEARAEWETLHPTTPWQKVKAGVQHAWQRLTE